MMHSPVRLHPVRARFLVHALRACSLLFLAILLASPARAQITRAQAISAVTSEVILPDPNAGTLVAYAPQIALQAGDVVRPWDDPTSPLASISYPIGSMTWFVWIDDHPSRKFTHPTRFVFVDANNPSPTVGNGGIVVTPAEWWPVINGTSFYSDSLERVTSADRFHNSPPDGRVLPPPPAPSGPAGPESNTKGAILVSGSAGKEFEGDIMDLDGAMQAQGGVPAGNIKKKVDATMADLKGFITDANNAGWRKVFVHIGSHGAVDRIQFDDRWYTATELACELQKLMAQNICITIESCKSGSLLDEIKTKLAGKTGVSIAATDAAKDSYYWVNHAGTDGNSYFVEDFIACWANPAADGPDAGTDVSQSEAFEWVKANGSATTRGQNPQKRTHGLQVNEIYASHAGTDNREFIELTGPPGEPLDGHMVLIVEGDGTSAGTLDRVWDLTGFSYPGSGIFVLGDAGVVPPPDFVLGTSDTIENGTETIYLIEAGQPSVVLAALGTNVVLSGSATMIPTWGDIIDHFALVDGGYPATDTVYDEAPVFGPDGTFLPSGIYRCSDETFDWAPAFLDFDPGVPGPHPASPGNANQSCAPGVVICTGEPGTPCPCGNHSLPGSGDGCLNSQGQGGRLRATGAASLGSDGLVLLGSQMSANGPGLYFQGTARINGGLGNPFGDGLRCAGGAVIRLGIKFAAGGASQYPEGGDPAVSVQGMVLAPGLRVYQVWYRNAPPFCTSATFNLTNGLEVNWQP